MDHKPHHCYGTNVTWKHPKWDSRQSNSLYKENHQIEPELFTLSVQSNLSHLCLHNILGIIFHMAWELWTYFIVINIPLRCLILQGVTATRHLIKCHTITFSFTIQNYLLRYTIAIAWENHSSCYTKAKPIRFELIHTEFDLWHFSSFKTKFDISYLTAGNWQCV